jgi:SAM-dependent methyltransferase
METTGPVGPDAAAAAQQKERDRATWAAGDWPVIARVTWEVGERVVRRAGVSAGEDVLDIGCGTGNAAIRAAQAGARVVGADLTPELFDAGRAEAAAAGVEVEFVQGDAEALPFADEAFDVVVSTFGCMFAPRHEVAAREAARVLRPGGRLHVFAWTPEGALGEMFRTVAGHVSQVCPATGPSPTLWGTEAHVTALFDGTGLDLAFERECVDLRFDSAAHMLATYEDKFGPIVMARRALEPLGRWPALRADLEALYTRYETPGGVVFSAEYLATDGRKRP